MTSPTTQKFTATKDPTAVLPYEWDWSEYLGTDWITNCEFITYPPTVGDTTPALVESFAFTNTTCTAVICGGTVGMKYRITCRITTVAGITDDRSLYLSIKDL